MTSVLALLTVLVAGLAPQPSAGGHRAQLAVPTSAPLTVRGTLFRSGERVVVVAQARGTHRRTVTATTRGTFLIRFRTVMLDRCTGYLIRATGNRGSFGYLRVIPECPAP